MTVINVWGNHLRLWKISYYSIFLLSLKSSWGMGNIPKPKGHKPVELFSSIFSFLKINYSLVLLRFEMLSSVLTNFYNVFYLNFHNYYLCNVHMSTSLFCHYQCFQGSIDLIGLFDLFIMMTLNPPQHKYKISHNMLTKGWA